MNAIVLESVPSLNRTRRKATSCIVFAAVLAVSVAFMASQVTHRFVPEDDGTHGHQAERVLNGEVPHLDYRETQTGGLPYLHAVAFRVLGVNVLSMRLALLALFSLWVPAVWYVARKFVSVEAAAGITLLVAGCSVPIYPCPEPPWYELYLATFGTASLFKFLEGRNRRWILVAGLCAGLSFLVEVRGLYFVAAVLLFLVFDEQVTSGQQQGNERLSGAGYSIFATLALFAFVTSLLWLIHGKLSTNEVFHFVVPGGVLAGILVVNEWRTRGARSLARFKRLSWTILPFIAAFLFPVAIFLTRYSGRGELATWFRGVFVIPTARIQRHQTFLEAPYALLTMLSVPLFLVLFLGVRLRGRARTALFVTITTGLLGSLLIFSVHHHATVMAVWYSASASIPLGVMIGAPNVISGADKNHMVPRERLMLMLAVATMFSLVQFPYSGPLYFVYAAPLWILAITALYAGKGDTARWWALAPVGAFYLGFVLLQAFPTRFYSAGILSVPFPQKSFTIPRASPVKGDAVTVDEYERLIPEIARHAAGKPIYAAPDAPDVYFLSGLRNPTPVVIEFASGTDFQPAPILHSIDAAGVRVAVINRGWPNYSGPLPQELEEGLKARFPHSTIIGRFEVRWN